MSLKICDHLEHKLNYSLNGNKNGLQVATVYWPDMERAMTHEDYKALTPSLSYEAIDQFEERLRTYGLEGHEINILVDKFCYGLTLDEIAKDLLTNVSSIYRVYRTAIGKLKSLGYEL